jgi:hypothetical protein
MQKTVPTIQIHSKDEYNIVALFSEQSIKMIISFQEKLKTKLGDVIWLTPASILHATLMEVIWDTDYQNKTRHEYFLEWYDKYNQTTKDIINSFSPFRIIFNQLEVSPNAIIIKSSNPKKFNVIRNHLLQKTNLPKGTRLPPSIAHCTIARFNKQIDLRLIINEVKSLRVDLVEEIKEFALVKDLVPPAFNPVVIETYRLNNNKCH